MSKYSGDRAAQAGEEIADGQASRLKTLLVNRKFDLSYCRHVCEIFIASGLAKARVEQVVKDVFADRAAASTGENQ